MQEMQMPKPGSRLRMDTEGTLTRPLTENEKELYFHSLACHVMHVSHCRFQPFLISSPRAAAVPTKRRTMQVASQHATTTY